MVCDTGMWDRETPSICVALRGLVGEEITVKAANRDLHSGMYGGAAANPIRILAKILADIHDETGRVTIPGFYDGVEETPSQILKSLEQSRRDGESFLGPIGLSIPSGEKGRSLLELVWARPTAEFNGIIRRLHRQGLQDRDRRGSIGKSVFPPRAQAGPGKDPREFPRLRRGAASGRLLGRVPPAWRLAGHPALLRLALPVEGQGGAVGRMAEAGGDHRHGRLDPDRRRLQDRISAWNRCWSASASTTTASIRPTRNTT
jgi:hypothetical protein